MRSQDAVARCWTQRTVRTGSGGDCIYVDAAPDGVFALQHQEKFNQLVSAIERFPSDSGPPKLDFLPQQKSAGSGYGDHASITEDTGSTRCGYPCVPEAAGARREPLTRRATHATVVPAIELPLALEAAVLSFSNVNKDLDS